MTRPTKQNNNLPFTGSIVSSENVIWENQSLPDCIELCHGDTVSDISVKIANAVCDLQNTLDFTTIDLSCLEEDCDHCRTIDTDKSISNILECLAIKYCNLYTYVHDTTNFDGGEGGVYDVDMKCLPTLLVRNIPTGGLKNKDIVQWVIDGVCEVKTELDAAIIQINKNLADAVADLQLEIMNHTGSGTGSIPLVNSDCLFSGNLSIDFAWDYLDTDYCLYKEQLGSIADITAARAQETSCVTNINTILGTSLVASTNQAESVKNLWEVICNLTTQIDAMQAIVNNCCSFSCKDFEITMTTLNYDQAAATVDLRLLFNGATTLPTSVYDFTNDSSNTVIFTDQTGYALSHVIDITDSATYQDLSLTGLDLTGDVTVDANLSFTVTEQEGDHRSFSCTKCIHTIFRSGSACAFCTLRVTIIGENPEVKITFSVNGQEQTIIITEETGLDAAYKEYIIPAGATISSIVNTNNSSVTIVSVDCPNLVIPEIATLACYSFMLDETLYNRSSNSYYYNIVGFMVGGVDIITFSNPVRADLLSTRTTVTGNGYTDGDTETCSTGHGNKTFGQLSSSTVPDYFQNSLILSTIPTNNYIYSLTKICSSVINSYGLDYNNLIYNGIAGKTIFLKLVAITGTVAENPSFLNPLAEIYIKGVEIPSGNDCDCCYVYDGS